LPNPLLVTLLHLVAELIQSHVFSFVLPLNRVTLNLRRESRHGFMIIVASDGFDVGRLSLGIEVSKTIAFEGNAVFIEGRLVGIGVGADVGTEVGFVVGEVVCTRVGEDVGPDVGEIVCIGVGTAVGSGVGEVVGGDIITVVGFDVGESSIVTVGPTKVAVDVDGISVGADVGSVVGSRDGEIDGIREGADVGSKDGTVVAVGSCVG
jgi:hypothetical protein